MTRLHNNVNELFSLNLIKLPEELVLQNLVTETRHIVNDQELEDLVREVKLANPDITSPSLLANKVFEAAAAKNLFIDRVSFMLASFIRSKKLHT